MQAVQSRLIIVSGWLGWFSVFFVRFAPSPVLILIEREFGVSHSDASLIFTSHLLAYASMQIPAGMMSDIVGPARVMSLGLIAMSISSLAMGLSQGVFPMIVLAFVAGLGAGTFYTSSTSLVSMAFPPRERGRALGIAYSGIGAGASAAIIIGGVLGNMGLWREIFYLASIPGIAAATISVRAVLPSRDNTARWGSGMLSTMLETLKKREIVVYNIVHSLLLVAYFSVTSFMPTYIASAGDLPLLHANLVALSLSIPEIFGGFVGGRLIGRMGAGRVIFISFASLALSILAIPHIRPPLYTIFLLPLIGFMSRAAATALPVLVIEGTPVSVVGAILGWYNSLGFIGGSLGPFLFGSVADAAGFSQAYSATAIFPIAALLLLGTVRRSRSP